jgi:hypothetical protein
MLSSGPDAYNIHPVQFELTGSRINQLSSIVEPVYLDDLVGSAGPIVKLDRFNSANQVGSIKNLNRFN